MKHGKPTTKDMTDINRLADALVEIEATQNITTIQEFMTYVPLFSTKLLAELSDQEKGDLSTRYVIRFNPYEPIVVKRGEEVVFTIPRMFIPIKSITEEHLSLLNKFHQDGSSDIPKYSSEATQAMLLAILKSQKDSNKYVKEIKAISKEYQEQASYMLSQNGKTADDDIVKDAADSEVDIDSVDGLSWS